MKELVYKPLPTSLHQLKEKITLTFRNIPEPMVQKAVYGMKKRAKKLVKTGGQVFEGKQIRIPAHIYLLCGFVDFKLFNGFWKFKMQARSEYFPCTFCIFSPHFKIYKLSAQAGKFVRP